MEATAVVRVKGHTGGHYKYNMGLGENRLTFQGDSLENRLIPHQCHLELLWTCGKEGRSRLLVMLRTSTVTMCPP